MWRTVDNSARRCPPEASAREILVRAAHSGRAFDQPPELVNLALGPHSVNGLAGPEHVAGTRIDEDFTVYVLDGEHQRARLAAHIGVAKRSTCCRRARRYLELFDLEFQ